MRPADNSLSQVRFQDILKSMRWFILVLLLALPVRADWQLRDYRGSVKAGAGTAFPGMTLLDGRVSTPDGRSGAVLRSRTLTLGLAGSSQCELSGDACTLSSGALYYQGRGVLGAAGKQFSVDGEGILTADGQLSVMSGASTPPPTLPASQARQSLGALWPYFRAGGEPLWERVLTAETVAYDPSAVSTTGPPTRSGMGVSYNSASSSGPAPTISGGSLSNTTSSGAVGPDYPIGLVPHEQTLRGTPTLSWLSYPRAAQYVVLVSRDHFTTLAWTARVTSTSTAPPLLDPGAYSWRVAALDGAGRVLGRVSESSFLIHGESLHR